LADTVIDMDEARLGNGFGFTDYNPAALLGALRRALARYRQPARWAALQKRGMRQAAGLGWERSARAYQALYQNALAQRENA
jgi:starch synthase